MLGHKALTYIWGMLSHRLFTHTWDSVSACDSGSLFCWISQTLTFLFLMKQLMCIYLVLTGVRTATTAQIRFLRWNSNLLLVPRVKVFPAVMTAVNQGLICTWTWSLIGVCLQYGSVTLLLLCNNRSFNLYFLRDLLIFTLRLSCSASCVVRAEGHSTANHFLMTLVPASQMWVCSGFQSGMIVNII